MDTKAGTLLRALTAATQRLRECRSKQEIRNFFGRRSMESARKHHEWLSCHEKQFLAVIARGDQIDASRVQPVLQAVSTQEDRELFRYARFTSSLPFSDRVGRRLRFSIRDASVANAPLIGIAALGSPVLDLRARDEFVFGTATGNRGRRQQRLSSMSELYVAVRAQALRRSPRGKAHLLLHGDQGNRRHLQPCVRTPKFKTPRPNLHHKCIRTAQFSVQSSKHPRSLAVSKDWPHRRLVCQPFFRPLN